MYTSSNSVDYLHHTDKMLNLQASPVGGANKGFPLGDGGCYFGCDAKVRFFFFWWGEIRIRLDHKSHNEFVNILKLNSKRIQT